MPLGTAGIIFVIILIGVGLMALTGSGIGILSAFKVTTILSVIPGWFWLLIIFVLFIKLMKR